MLDAVPRIVVPATIDMNGMSVKSCSVFAAQADGAEITTIEEGLGTPDAAACTAGNV